jgi:UDP-hydrolysing UDP-N-acetyl-D-glucosamine 2-epimerase
MRRIGVVTVGRSDFGIYLPMLRRIRATRGLQLQLYVTGMHLSPEFGLSHRLIDAAGFRDYERIESLLSSDTPTGIAKSMGVGVAGFAEVFGRNRPDILIVLGDRFEMHAAALAALPFKIPVAHIHGGEVTAGAIDDALRHSMTKMSHLHFVSAAEYGQRVRQLGEEAWRVTVAGALGLDNLRLIRIPSRRTLQKRLGRRLPERFLLVTYHPVTLEYEDTAWQIAELLEAIEGTGFPPIFTLPNADTSGRIIASAIRDYAARHPAACCFENLGTELYFGMMGQADAMVGNSSSGIIEAASFHLPVVNVGTRQAGRLRPANVIDCGNDRSEIKQAVHRALSPSFRRGPCRRPNPFDRGGAAEAIVRRLQTVPLDDRLTIKRFVDLH